MRQIPTTWINTCFFSSLSIFVWIFRTPPSPACMRPQEQVLGFFVCLFFFYSYSWRWLVLSWHPGLRCRSRRCIRTSQTALWWWLSVASVVLPSRISACLQQKEGRNLYRRELLAGNDDLETESSTDCGRVKPTDEGTNVSAAPQQQQQAGSWSNTCSFLKCLRG